MNRIRWTFVAMVACAMVAWAADQLKDQKTKAASSSIVDSGSFGVFVKGQRVLTESFSIQQANGTSSIKSELKEAAGSGPTNQKSNLEMTGNRELIRYEWSQGGPGGASLIVLPNNEFLLEKITSAGSSKPAEQPFLMPNTSSVLDNNFFVQREVLAWRYLADLEASCKPQGGNPQCRSGPLDYGVLVPQDRTSMHVRVEAVGKEKVPYRGTDRELLRLKLQGDAFEWALWLDPQDNFKLMRVAIPADSTEAVRD